MHPRQPELVGQELWDLRDTQGQPVIQNLLAAARRGGQRRSRALSVGTAVHPPERGKARLCGGAGTLGLDAGHRHLPGRRQPGPAAHRRGGAGQHPRHVRLGRRHRRRLHPGCGRWAGAEHQRPPPVRRQAAADGAAAGADPGRRARAPVARAARRHQPGAGVDQAVAGGGARAVAPGAGRRAARAGISTPRWAARWTG